MGDPSLIVRNNRNAILIGEIGVLLHDIGKCHPDFIGKNSLENISKEFKHSNIDNFLKGELVKFIKNEKFKFKINDKEADIYTLITKHHENSENLLINLMKSCDRLDSADDKGIVRKKQSLKNTIISSPFGYKKEQIDLDCLQKRFDDLQDRLKESFNIYISNSKENKDNSKGYNLTCFRQSLIINLKSTFSHALGETRIPSNDVTLWDHSHSTASLFKSVLCAIALGESLDSQKLQWRLLGFCWDGIDFINKGKKVADILKRNEIIEEIKIELKKKFEDEIPIGNAIYEDINGIYFTFPSLNDDKSKELAKECTKEGLEIIRAKSDNEIWPFFTLSKSSRSLTILTDELRFADKKRNIPKMSPMLFVEGKGEQIDSNPDMPVPKNGEDLCPVCRMRTKAVSDERCDICEKRRKGRLQDWFNNKENTIWTDEVADKNNHVALLSLNFNLDKWLDGTMVGTIYSQTFEDWKSGIKKGKDTIQLLKEANINTVIKSNKETVYSLLDEIINNSANDKKKAAQILNTFFQDVDIAENHFDEHISNIKNRIGTDELTKENLAKYLFTQNPSPARLYRIWRETEEFFEVVAREIKEKLYPHKWKRIKFSIDISNLNLKSGKKIEKNTPYLIKIKGLEPDNLLVFHSLNGCFYTIESLEKFKLNNKNETEAIEYGLKNKGFYHLAYEDKIDESLLTIAQPVKISNIETEEYYPFIEITNSPLLLRLIVPASDAIKILNEIVNLYNERFKKVIGKLPLYAGLLVVKRKFPLYVLLDAGERLLHGQEFAEPERMNPWWNIERIDKYHEFYPTKELSEEYNLDDLAPLSEGKQYSLYPGYFDFDLLLGTDNRYKITYEKKRRVDEDYKLFSKRPYYFYQISKMIDLWQILKNNLSGSQINFIEESLTSKLREWRDVDDTDKEQIFRKFTEATLKDAFGDRWKNFRPETQSLILNSVLNGLLLDTIVLFRHIIKQREDEENE